VLYLILTIAKHHILYANQTKPLVLGHAHVLDAFAARNFG
jgi:hypothetical protein